MAQATYDIWVKGSPEKNELGDCKFLYMLLLAGTKTLQAFARHHTARLYEALGLISDHFLLQAPFLTG